MGYILPSFLHGKGKIELLGLVNMSLINMSWVRLHVRRVGITDHETCRAFCEA